METADREALKKQRMRVSRRLTLARRSLLGKTPFYGRLLLRTPFAFAPCKTAMTNMEQILFDPEFVDEIDDEQLEFVLLHEILHCALGHPLRAGTMNFDLFQIDKNHYFDRTLLDDKFLIQLLLFQLFLFDDRLFQLEKDLFLLFVIDYLYLYLICLIYLMCLIF